MQRSDLLGLQELEPGEIRSVLGQARAFKEILSRRIKKAIAEQLPKESPKGAVWYGVSRSTMIRRWRFPKPEVTES